MPLCLYGCNVVALPQKFAYAEFKGVIGVVLLALAPVEVALPFPGKGPDSAARADIQTVSRAGNVHPRARIVINCPAVLVIAYDLPGRGNRLTAGSSPSLI